MSKHCVLICVYTFLENKTYFILENVYLFDNEKHI